MWQYHEDAGAFGHVCAGRNIVCDRRSIDTASSRGDRLVSGVEKKAHGAS